MSLKSGISVTPPNLSAVSALRWRNPLSEKKTFIIQSLLAITGGFRERNMLILRSYFEPFSFFTLDTPTREEGSPFRNELEYNYKRSRYNIVFKAAESDIG